MQAALQLRPRWASTKLKQLLHSRMSGLENSMIYDLGCSTSSNMLRRVRYAAVHKSSLRTDFAFWQILPVENWQFV